MALSYSQTHQLQFHGCVENEILLARVNADVDVETLAAAFQARQHAVPIPSVTRALTPRLLYYIPPPPPSPYVTR